MRYLETQRIADTLFATISLALFLGFVLFLFLGDPM